jgi:Mor family transcriptional regulator
LKNKDFCNEIIKSKETREKISKANKGKKCSEETKKKLSQANKGNKRWLGKSHSEETKQKMSKAAKLRKPSVIRENFNDIKTKLENGYLIKDIASFYNVNPHTVYKVISDNNYIRKEHDPNVRKKLKGREKTEEEKRKNSLSKAGLYDKKEDIFKRRINGETIKNIASFYKVSPTTIWAILNPDKVKLKQQNRKPKKLF